MPDANLISLSVSLIMLKHANVHTFSQSTTLTFKYKLTDSISGIYSRKSEANHIIHKFKMTHGSNISINYTMK